MEGADLLGGAEAALAEGDFDRAVALCEQATEVAEVEAHARHLLGGLRMMDERLAEAVAEWEVAFRLLRAAGHNRAEAGGAMDLADMHNHFQGHPSAANGWRERARRCLADEEQPCAESGYLELAVMACDIYDTDDLLAATERALAIAEGCGDTTLEARALADQGLALVSRGRTADGYARLDAALAMISAGEVNPVAVGQCLCSMLTACDRSGDVARAEEWTALVHDVYCSMAPRPVVMFTHCRVAYGSVLSAAGRWSEAESELIGALGRPERPNDLHRSKAIAHLAALRLDQGRVEEAAELLAPFADHVTSCGPLARVHLAREELDLAAAVLQRGIEELVGDALRRAPLLALLAETRLRADDVAGAREAAATLAAVAAAADLPAVRTLADRTEARVLVAEGDEAAARDRLTEALGRHTDEDTLLVAGLRLDRARIRVASGDAPGALDDGRAALAGATRLGAIPLRDAASALLRELGDTGRLRPQRASEVAEILSGREQEVLALVAEGLTNAEIAQRLYISKKTAEHHVGRVLTKLGVRSRAEAAALAVRLSASAQGSDRGSGRGSG